MRFHGMAISVGTDSGQNFPFDGNNGTDVVPGPNHRSYMDQYANQEWMESHDEGTQEMYKNPGKGRIMTPGDNVSSPRFLG